MNEEFGPIVRAGPNELSFVEGRAWKDIYGYRGPNGETFGKDHMALGPDLTESERGLHRADDKSHSHQRRIFSHAFSNRALKEQEPLIRYYLQTLIKLLYEQAKNPGKQPADFARMYNFTSFDIMADLTFGEPLGMLKSGEYGPWASDSSSYPKTMALSIVFRAYPLLSFLKTWLLLKSIREKRKRHIEYSMRQVEHRL